MWPDGDVGRGVGKEVSFRGTVKKSQIDWI